MLLMLLAVIAWRETISMDKILRDNFLFIFCSFIILYCMVKKFILSHFIYYYIKILGAFREYICFDVLNLAIL